MPLADDGNGHAAMISGWIDGSAAPASADPAGTVAHGYEVAPGRGSQFSRGAHVALCTGTPVFLDDDVVAVARTAGNAAAWLELHRKKGRNAPARAHGRFAVAILDRAERSAFLAVDRFAIESWCFAVANDRFAFANRADAVPFVSREIDPQAIFDYLYFHMIPAPRTILRGVSRLLPGHSVSFQRGRCSVERYWEPRFDESCTDSFAQLRDEFRGLLRSAVAREADTGALGSYLSGGTDSSTVAGMIGEVTGQPARTYSIGFDAAGYDEMEYARIAARHFGTDHHEYYVTPDDLVDNIPRVAGEFDQPFGNSSALPAYCCARMAHADGVRKLLAGDGGDELFGGNSRYARQRVFEAYNVLPTPLRRNVVEPVVSGVPRLASIPLLRKAVSYVEQARVPMPDRMEMYNLLQRVGVANVLERGFVETVDPESPLLQQRSVYRINETASLINRMLAYDWKFTLADNDLPKVVGSANAAGVATAFPLLDERLVEFSLKLGPELKLKGLKLRYFFKEALRGFLPEAIITKKKHGFGLPFGVWAVAHSGLRQFALDSLNDLKARGFVRPAFVDDLVDRRLPAHPGYYGEMVWILMMLEQWLRAPGHPKRLG